MSSILTGVSSSLGLDSQLQLAAVRARVLGISRAPVQIGRFRVLERIGAGGMGVVYAAHDDELDRRLALKLVHRSMRDDRGRARMRREARALARLSHPNVVQLHEIGEHEGQFFVAMEFIDGPTLREWTSAARRTWREIIDMYVQSGHGLAAAHAAGVVHGDFKPDNVMVGEDGRARVLDFGLSRASAPEPSGDRDARILDAMSDEAITTAGAYGTPAYMAPEQFTGRGVDARSDQFSFCVSMWEALYGARPFAGVTFERLRDALLSDRPTEPRPRGAPSWIRRVLTRGLRRDRARRFDSMRALLVSLDWRARRRRRALLSFAAGASFASALVYTRADAAASCVERAQRSAAQVWNTSRAETLARAFTATRSSYARQVTAQVMARVDAYVRAWVELHRVSCEAAVRFGELSGERLDRRSDCLGDRLRELDVQLAHLERADTARVATAVSSVTGLPSPLQCASETSPALARPTDPAVSAAVEDVRAGLAEVAASMREGRPGAVRERAAALVREAEATGYRPCLSEAQVQLGELLASLDARAQASATLFDALKSGASLEHHSVVARALIGLVHTDGVLAADVRAGTRWAELAELELAHHALGSQLTLELLDRWATMAWNAGEHERSLELRERAEQTAVDALGDQHAMTATVRVAVARGLWARARYDDAERVLQSARATLEATLGPEHPEVAAALGELGRVAWLRGQNQRAIELYDRQLELLEAAFGPAHSSLVVPLNARGAARMALNTHEPPHLDAIVELARADFQRGLEVAERTYGPDSLGVTRPLDNLAVLALDQLDLIAARVYIARGLASRQEHLDASSPELARSLSLLADLEVAEGDHEAALGLYRRVAELREGLDVHVIMVGEAELGIALSLWCARRDTAGARDHLREAVAAFRRHGPVADGYQREIDALRRDLDAHDDARRDADASCGTASPAATRPPSAVDDQEAVETNAVESVRSAHERERAGAADHAPP